MNLRDVQQYKVHIVPEVKHSSVFCVIALLSYFYNNPVMVNICILYFYTMCLYLFLPPGGDSFYFNTNVSPLSARILKCVIWFIN